MAISTIGSGYQFLPPVIRPDSNATSGTPADSSSTGTAATASLRIAAPAVPVHDDAEGEGTGKHLLRIVA